ncbi:hypothetical protein VT84_17985 [Gemmata sp. SH-PL17]|uniref:hypothetical protein n=1 Tax=Gemmata sp. SH-PL17 TaxID=1630693 RepID=UPI0004B57201|nr:hypothetical protein [Gemmata sp. SH-PL17]AMV26293.1 hypothetical protein VT84_17985 [Gemmata sp. SH-PL17]
MLTCLTLSLVLGAPVPPAGTPATMGPLPRLLEVKPDTDGKITVPVTRAEKQQQQGGVIVIGINGNPNGGQAQLEIQQDVAKSVPLTEVKELKVYTADGKEVTVADATKRLAKGGTVVVSADGKKVDPRHLKLFRDDVLVFVSPELAAPGPNAMPGGNVVFPNLQFQVVPALPAAPAVPAVPPPPAK